LEYIRIEFDTKKENNFFQKIVLTKKGLVLNAKLGDKKWNANRVMIGKDETGSD